MTVVTAKCDDCEKIVEGENGEMFPDYDGIIRCEECHIKNKISYLESGISEKESWLEECHLIPLREMKNKLENYKSKLEIISTQGG